MKTFDVEANITFKASVDDIEAKTEQEAINIAKAKLDDFYRLTSLGCPHSPMTVKIDFITYDHND